MKLAYGQAVEWAAVQYLERDSDGRMVELSVHDQQDAETYALVALAGHNKAHPDRERCMGPFHSRQQAAAAIAAVCESLMREGFVAREQGVRRWQLHAARVARSVRAERNQHHVDTRFVPLGIVPDHNDTF